MMTLYGEVRQTFGPLYRWTAKEREVGVWKVVVFTTDHFETFDMDLGRDLLDVSLAVTQRVVEYLKEMAGV